MELMEIKSNLDVVTVKQLNRLSAAQNMLVLLRILITKDMYTHTYDMFDKSTVRDILDVADGILQSEDMPEDCSDVVDYTYLTMDEKSEFVILVEQMREYAGWNS